jgi:hypothetical protein
MADKTGDDRVSLYPLTFEEARHGLLRVKPKPRDSEDTDEAEATDGDRA